MTSLAPRPAEKRAAIYVRVSTTGQEDEGTSLQTQEERSRAYVQEHGYTVPADGLFREVHSGADLKERPELSRLREALRSGRFDVVVAYAVDRLSRDQNHIGILLYEAEQGGAVLEFVTEKFEDTVVGRFIMAARAFGADLEREKIRERVTRGRRARAEAGKILPSKQPLYGYRFSADRTKYEPDPDTAPIVRAMFAASAAGKSIRAIANDLTERGVPTPTGRQTYWQYTVVGQLLRKPAYGGHATAWRYEAHKDKRRGTRSMKVRAIADQVELPEGVVPALVEPAIFEAVQDRLVTNKERATRNNQHPESSLLRGGFLRCGYCGSNMHAQASSNPNPGYICGRVLSQHKDACSGHSIKVRILDAIVWDKVVRILSEPDVITNELEKMRTQDTSAAQLGDVERNLARVTREERNYVDRLGQVEGPAADQVVVKLNELSKRHEQLRAERETLLDRQAQWEVTVKGAESLAPWLREIGTAVDQLSYDEKRLAMDALGVRVKLWRIDHEPRWEITAAIPLGDSIVYGLNQRTVRNLTLAWRDTPADAAFFDLADRDCAWCGTPFTPARGVSRFCGATCRKLAIADRRKAAKASVPAKVPIRGAAAGAGAMTGA